MAVLRTMMFNKKPGFLLSALLANGIAAAEDWDFGGHVKYQFDSTHYQSDNSNAQYGSPENHLLDFRLKAQNHWGAWNAQIHYEVLARYTPKSALSKAGSTATSFGLPEDERRLFKLTHEWGNSDKAVQRLDRFFAGYNGEQLVLRVGRQVVSWGNGLIFHPLDIFSPFSPTEIDKDYKTGDDMLYGQWLFDSGDDLQMILLPRRNPDTDSVESDQSSLAFKYHGIYKEEWDFDLLAARHFDENVFGFGLSKDILGAIWRFDISATRLKKGGTTVSLISNMDYSWVWFEKNFYGYIEYFRNGTEESAKYLSPDPAIQTGRDYIGSGVQIELTPLFNFYASWIGSLHDSSGIFQIRGIYDWSENLQMIVWLDELHGSKGTEFGGIPASDNGKYIAPGRKAYLHLSYYF